MLHLFPHWNWLPGQEVDLWAYYNQADEAELFINGQSQGVKSKLSSRPERRDLSTTLEMTGGEERVLSTPYHVSWRVNFAPGEIKVITRKSGDAGKPGTPVCSQIIRTAGAPDHIRLSIDYKGKDLTFITAEVVDKDGNLCPWADNQIYFKGADVVATDNGCQTSMERFTSPTRKAFHGKCLVVVRGSGTLTAQSIDLTQASLDF
jgi:beta-galactosidase